MTHHALVKNIGGSKIPLVYFRRFRACSHVAGRGYTCHESSLASGKFGARTGSVAVLNTSRSMIAIHRGASSAVWRTCFARTETPLSFLSSRSAETLRSRRKNVTECETTFWWFASNSIGTAAHFYATKTDARIRDRTSHLSQGSRGFRSWQMISVWTNEHRDYSDEYCHCESVESEDTLSSLDNADSI